MSRVATPAEGAHTLVVYRSGERADSALRALCERNRGAAFRSRVTVVVLARREDPRNGCCGYMGSLVANVSRQGSVIADLAPTSRRADGRYVVTLPVGFTRPGTVGVDVIAEGVPRSRRCGARVFLRRSTPKTLTVTVR